MKFTSRIAATLARALYLWFELFDRIYRTNIHLRGDDSGLSISLERPPSRIGSIDDRIAQIDSAREHLADALEAIDHLKQSAEHSKTELAHLQQRFAALEEKKANAESRLEKVKEATRTDVETFRTLAGIPNIKKERLVGFVSGIFASLVAAGLIFVIGFVLKHYFSSGGV